MTAPSQDPTPRERSTLRFPRYDWQYQLPWQRYRAARNGDIGPGGAGCQRWVSLFFAFGASVNATRRRRG